MNSSISRCDSSRKRHDHAIDGAVGLQHDLALRNVEIERPALVAGTQHGTIGGVQRLQHVLRNRLGHFVGTSGHRELRLLVMQFCGGADQHAVNTYANVCGRRRRSPC